MVTTIAEMQVGDKLYLGTYGVNPERQYRISWLKASREGEFLSEFALDYLMYDASESMNRANPFAGYGTRNNSSYRNSNILQFMNSEEPGGQWFGKTHENDAPPVKNDYYGRRLGGYDKQPGFLSGFRPHEIASLVGQINLPTLEDIVGVRRFPLFKRKGFRAKPSYDMSVNASYYGFDEFQFVDFMTQTIYNEQQINRIGRDGKSSSASASLNFGFRPKCCINLDAKVAPIADGTGYALVPFVVEKDEDTRTIDDIFQFFGLQ